MWHKISTKFKSNLSIYWDDLKAKGFYYSILHRLYKIPYLKLALEPVDIFLKPESIFVGGHKIFIDKSDKIVSEKLLQSKRWEPYESDLFEKSVEAGDVVVDIGAHIGYYTLIAASKVGPKGKVFAFEPDKKNFSLLKKNVKSNGYQNVIMVNKAVSDKTGTLKLFINSSNTGDHRIYSSNDKRESISVKVISLDNFFKDKNQKIDVIKIDVQGSEYQAFQGAKNLIYRSKKIIIFTEFSPNLIRLTKANPKNYLNFFEKGGFTVMELDEENEKVAKADLTKILDVKNLGLREYVNLICTRDRSIKT